MATRAFEGEGLALDRNAIDETGFQDGLVGALGVVGGGDEEEAGLGREFFEVDIGPVFALEVGEVVDFDGTVGLVGQLGDEAVGAFEIGLHGEGLLLGKEFAGGGGVVAELGERGLGSATDHHEVDLVERVEGGEEFVGLGDGALPSGEVAIAVRHAERLVDDDDDVANAVVLVFVVKSSDWFEEGEDESDDREGAQEEVEEVAPLEDAGTAGDGLF